MVDAFQAQDLKALNFVQRSILLKNNTIKSLKKENLELKDKLSTLKNFQKCLVCKQSAALRDNNECRNNFTEDCNRSSNVGLGAPPIEDCTINSSVQSPEQILEFKQEPVSMSDDEELDSIPVESQSRKRCLGGENILSKQCKMDETGRSGVSSVAGSIEDTLSSSGCIDYDGQVASASQFLNFTPYEPHPEDADYGNGGVVADDLPVLDYGALDYGARLRLLRVKADRPEDSQETEFANNEASSGAARGPVRVEGGGRGAASSSSGVPEKLECELCLFTALSKSDMARHLRQSHGQFCDLGGGDRGVVTFRRARDGCDPNKKPAQKFACPYAGCSLLVPVLRSHLFDHIAKFHPLVNDQTPFFCPVSNCPFQTELRAALMVHLSEDHFSCKDRNTVSASKSDVAGDLGRIPAVSAFVRQNVQPKCIVVKETQRKSFSASKKVRIQDILNASESNTSSPDNKVAQNHGRSSLTKIVKVCPKDYLHGRNSIVPNPVNMNVLDPKDADVDPVSRCAKSSQACDTLKKSQVPTKSKSAGGQNRGPRRSGFCRQVFACSVDYCRFRTSVQECLERHVALDHAVLVRVEKL